MMEKINDVVEWDNIEAVLNEHYEVGRSKEGADAFPPLLLMKRPLHNLPKFVQIESLVKRSNMEWFMGNIFLRGTELK